MTDALPARPADTTPTTPEVAATRDLRADRVGLRFLELIPREFAREHLVVSQGERDGVEFLAVSARSDALAVFNVAVRLERPTERVIAEDEVIARIVDQAYEGARGAGADSFASTSGTDGGLPGDSGQPSIEELIAEADRDLLSVHGKAPIVRLVDAILFEALSRGASDVHIQPLARETLIRYRLDGILHTVRTLGTEVSHSVVSRIKVMGRMDIAEKRVPQDGRATVTIGTSCGEDARGRAIDLRISTLPTSYGERAVVRLLDNSRQLCDLERIGMPPDVRARYLERATRSNGIILVTGPTGSGKTTTLYSTLRRVGSARANIMTIEDPIEYELASLGDGIAISQSQVNPRKGVTFATGLRHILRQDPDIVMVGEIRDGDTARIAIQSSLTGHLVFSTLHTNDAVSAISRLIDLGIEPYLVSASLSAVLAQRLVRLIHPECRGNGCESCMGTGYRGRTGVFELMVVTERLRSLVSSQAAISAIREAAAADGLRPLAEEGRRLALEGLTTEDEVRRVILEVL